jgi:CHAT domain-containing protein
VRDRLSASHLVIVPHNVLHAIPFHALFDGTRYVGDDFTVSYAPSASIYRLCRAKPHARGAGALIMGVPDAMAPLIADEVTAVAEIMPEARVFVGAEATAAQLRSHAAESRFVHLATHARFRSDNAMFSSILLGDGPLCVYDLYQMQLPSELVTLSGCGTGLASSVAGDEQVGLVRGLLYAGARTVLLTLWDAHDRATATFMQVFYRSVQGGLSPARALQHGMQVVRGDHSHPFYWAPFILIGDAGADPAAA